MNPSRHPSQRSADPLQRPHRRRRRSPLMLLALFFAGAVSVWGITDIFSRAVVEAVEPQVTQTAALGDMWSQASFPVEDFQAYTSPFGYRSDPYSGSQRFHYGLDLAAPSGSYIRNWWEGRVVEVSDDSACGTSVVLQSGNWLHIYCHMHGHVARDSSGRYFIDSAGGLRLQEGQTVPTGARIGRVGMTGRTTGPHLHWGLKYDDSWVDPALVLRAMYTSQQAVRQGN
ncbi:M23 family metallopeptidase [Leptolyngbya sp. PCC 6406]|uniref:M23 family metallopeptidase n=1 Tax=Leptolyngbya sp. PCC 6406 TaxID=1173264 RepID=UPI0002ABCE25|nr:M23 family metallopeptidase [Leptolyngbya sp. PCC 6406]